MHISNFTLPYSKFLFLAKMDNEPQSAGSAAPADIPVVPSTMESSITTSNSTTFSAASTSSPKIPIYNNLVASEQRGSPSATLSRRSLSRSATPTGATLQLKLNTAAKAPSVSGDVYEFHSSPEDAAGPIQGSGGFFSASSMILSKNASSSSSTTNLDSQQPPQKRIKTAILAKKLLAAAADSNIIDPNVMGISIAQSQGAKNPEIGPVETNEMEEGEREEDEDEEEGDEGCGAMEEDEDESERAGGGEEEERAQLGRANNTSSISVLVQEQKKVPPLRISLLKTPSEEGAENGGGTQLSPQQQRRNNRGGGRMTGTGRKPGHGTKKDDLQRVTRSRVRQIGAGDDVDGSGAGSSVGRKRRYRPTADGGQQQEEENDTMISAAAEGPGEEVIPTAGEDERSEDSQQSIKTAEGGGGGGAGTEKAGLGQYHSVAATILAKNSLEQSVAFETMIHDKWARNYKDHLELLTEQVESACLNPPQQQEPGGDAANSSNIYEGTMMKDWPESLQKLYTEQARRSQEMAEAHRMDRERIQGMAQREMARVAEAQREKKTTGSRMGQTQSNFMTIVSMLRDSECYDPALFAEQSSAPPGHSHHHHQSLAQVQQRFAYLANTARQRHAMEAQVLAGNHKAEWNRALRKIVRQNERQHMLKGTTAGRKQQQLQQIPVGCCSESVVPVVKVVDIALPTLPNI